MKTSKRPGILNRIIRLAILVAFSGTAAAAFAIQTSDGAPDPGNTECNSTSTERNIGPITGTGTSVASTSVADQKSARRDAEYNLENNIEEASGLVCKFCEPGPRCMRNAILTSGDLGFEYTEIAPVPEVHDGGWKCVATWTGKYKIQCMPC